MKSNLNLPICKLNLAIFLILAFKLYYNHYIISISILLISLLDIILFSGIKIKGRDKIKYTSNSFIFNFKLCNNYNY